MSSVGGVYVCQRGYQPTCVGTDENGELIWELKMKEPWHLEMFPVPYGGDFLSEWIERAHTSKYGVMDTEWMQLEGEEATHG